MKIKPFTLTELLERFFNGNWELTRYEAKELPFLLNNWDTNLEFKRPPFPGFTGGLSVIIKPLNAEFHIKSEEIKWYKNYTAIDLKKD